MSKGFAVIDLETTGLFPAKHDRIVEIGIVLVSPTGEIESRHETLVNPERDMGPQRIHGISAAAASRAPTFPQIAPRVAELLDYRVPVAHNASFDSRFLGFQMAEVTLPIAASDHWLCTMRMSESVSGYRRLDECCSALGIKVTNAHSAGGDAYATAEMLSVYMASVGDSAFWRSWLATAQHVGSFDAAASTPWVTRIEAYERNESFMDRLVGSLSNSQVGSQLNTDYLALLDRVLLDGVVSTTETSALVNLATELGLTIESIHVAHRAYFDGLASNAWADHVLTADEESELRSVGKLLGIDESVVAKAMITPTASPDMTKRAFQLAPGDIVVLTGDMAKPRDEWVEELTSLGIVVKNNVVKKTKLVVSADPDSMSGKARKAREYGVPIVTEDGLHKLLGLITG